MGKLSGTLIAGAVAVGCFGVSSPIAFAHCQSFDFSRVTGGGFVTSCSGGKNSFGFNFTPDITGQTLTVHLEYNDHQTGTDPIQIHADTVVSLNDATDVEDANETDLGIEFNTMADVRTATGDQQELIHVKVADNGEPGTNDIFQLTIVSGPDAGYTSGNPVISGGNIQLHALH